VDCKRRLPIGFGNTKPIAVNHGEGEGRELNQRIMFVNAELRGKPIGGMPVAGMGGVPMDACRADR